MALTPQEEAGIRQLLNDYIALWMDGQAQACADLYEPDGDLLAVDGVFLRGREEIKRYYDSVMTGKYTALRVENLRATAIRPLADGLALLDAAWDICTDGGPSPATVASPIGSFVVSQADDGWKIAAGRLMVPWQIKS